MADLYVQVEAARSLALAAAHAADEEEPRRARLLAAAAKSACAQAFSTAAGEMIQLHGAIALTWEHEAHRYFKRAHGTAQLFGTPAWHRSRLDASALLAPDSVCSS
ncbi:acyl-CoA dehydrogenase family protein [Streptomyces sp. SID14478]|uniref:acyl-CoA dehydrogenase family protein n=1 Tax=Streptomyces sp. SID14478 TaxID=2706073 RepID=UPI0023B2E633|nr:acyl-CoA dehydrogenase family protein [Streptomyces sp. SID14478]